MPKQKQRLLAVKFPSSLLSRNESLNDHRRYVFVALVIGAFVAFCSSDRNERLLICKFRDSRNLHDEARESGEDVGSFSVRNLFFVPLDAGGTMAGL